MLSCRRDNYSTDHVIFSPIIYSSIYGKPNMTLSCPVCRIPPPPSCRRWKPTQLPSMGPPWYHITGREREYVSAPEKLLVCVREGRKELGGYI
jgi:hypothetical protein